MANPRSFTDEDVIAAARTLTQQGMNITGTNLRSVIKRGRQDVIMATYNRLLEEGAIESKALPSEEVQIRQFEIPTEIAEMTSVILGDISKMISNINDLANDLAERRLNRAVEEAQTQAKLSIKRIADMEEMMSAAYEEVEDMREILESKSVEVNAYQEEIQQLKTQLTTATTRIDNLESKLIDKREQVSQLNKALEIAANENRDSTATILELELNLQQQVKEYESLNQSNQNLQKDLDLAELNFSQKHEDYLVLNEKLKNVTDENKKLVEKVTSLENGNAELQTKLLTSKDEAHQALKAKDKDLFDMVQRATVAETKLSTVVTENKKLAEDAKDLKAKLTKAETLNRTQKARISKLEKLAKPKNEN